MLLRAHCLIEKRLDEKEHLLSLTAYKTNAGISALARMTAYYFSAKALPYYYVGDVRLLRKI